MSTGPASLFFANGVPALSDIQFQLFIDNFLPNIVYLRNGDDLIVGNVFELVDLNVPGGSDQVSQEAKDNLDLTGLRIENLDFAFSIFAAPIAALAERGDLSMVFKIQNPLYAVLGLLPQTAFTGAIAAQGLAEEAISLAGFADRVTKALRWSEEHDPLVLDLDGDGIETSRLGTLDRGNDVHFDHDGDFFAERTGWLDGDDGFLALDKNSNGIIDEINELFGGPGLAGFTDLASYDSNNDGVIDAADLIWSDLSVAISNDFDLAEVTIAAAEQMTVASLKQLSALAA